METIILDFNDTIDDNFEVKKEALEKTLKGFGKSKELIVKKVLVEIDRVDLLHPDWDMIKIVSTALMNIVPKIIEEKAVSIASEYMEYRAAHARLNPSFVKAAPALAKKFKIIILTSGNKEHIMQLMHKYKISKYIEKFYFTNEIGLKKPSIELLEKVIKENKIDKNKCIVVGDDIIKDHMPAKLLGIKTILYSKFVDKLISDFNELA
ncbi:MAG: HAD family hydrolase [Candidatus Micrarchaeia archaeon]